MKPPPRLKPIAPAAPRPETREPVRERIVYVTREVQTTERTSKHWKALQALGVLAILGGFTILIFSPNKGLGAGLLVGGLASYLIARIGAWWTNG